MIGKESAKSTAAGAISFTFDAPARLSSWAGTVNIPLSPAGVVWVAYLTTIEFCSWLGSAAGGPIPISAGSRLSVKAATGLTPTTIYRIIPSGATYAETTPPTTSVAPVSSSTLIQNFLQVGGRFDFIGSFTKAAVATGSTFIVEPTIPPPTKTYNTLMVVLTRVTGAATPQYTTISEFFATRGPVPFGATPVPALNGGTTQWVAVIPFVNTAPVTTLSSGIACVTFVTALGTWKVTLWGSTSLLGVPLRSDGRCYPTGAFHKRATAAGAIVAAPASPLRILVKSLALSTIASATTNSEVSIGVGTSTTTRLLNFIAPKGGAGTQLMVWESGFLLPIATALTLGSSGGGNPRAIAVYDLAV